MMVEKKVSYVTKRPQKHLSKGTLALREAWEASGLTREAFGERIAVSGSQATSLLVGTARANRPTSKICLRELGIDPSLWNELLADDTPPAPSKDPIREALAIIARELGYNVA